MTTSTTSPPPSTLLLSQSVDGDATSPSRAAATVTTGTKRKRTEPKVRGFKQAAFKSFTSVVDAEAFLAGNDPTLGATPKFYAVRSGRVPGVYTDWPSAQSQITGWKKPRQRCFATRAEAEEFVKAGITTAGKDNHRDGTAEMVEDNADEATMQLFGEARLAAEHSGTVGPSAKKAEKLYKATSRSSKKSAQPPIVHDYMSELGIGPLPLDAEDGYDHRVQYNPATGQIERRSEEEAGRIHTRQDRTITLRPDEPIDIFTDGSSLANGTGNAIAGVGIYFGPSDPRNTSEPLAGPRQSNNRAELTAISRALEMVARNQRICINTDSEYSINCVTKWCVNWKKNNWTSAKGKPVENRDLIEAIIRQVDDRNDVGGQTDFRWLKGHATHEGNVAADQLAVDAARKARMA
ncbi:MAG: hypothetical protein M1826_002620 [Phylliscum demangeonii]|nr:MAG: hypothetical protein M1826_002620 [Phylliscum demangeonii]